MKIIGSRRHSNLGCVLAALEAVGRKVMDFGFGAFLEKFEEYFGKRATAALVILIGMAVVTLCLKIVLAAVLPLLQALYPVLTGPKEYVAPLLVTSTGLSLGALIGYVIYVKSKVREIRNVIKEATDRLNASTDVCGCR